MKINLYQIDYKSGLYRGAKREAAELMGIGYQTFASKFRRYDADAIAALGAIVAERHAKQANSVRAAAREAIIEVEDFSPADIEIVD